MNGGEKPYVRDKQYSWSLPHLNTTEATVTGWQSIPIYLQLQLRAI